MRSFMLAGAAAIGVIAAQSRRSDVKADVEVVGEPTTGNVTSAPEPEPDTRSRQVRRAEERARAKRYGRR